jgi:cytochrome P450
MIKGGGIIGLAEQMYPDPSTHAMSDREIHAGRRRILSQCFSESALKGQEPYVLQTVQRLISLLATPDDDNGNQKEQGWSSPIDMATYSGNFALDVLGELCFGKSFQALGHSRHFALSAMTEASQKALALGAIPNIELLVPLLRQHWLLEKLPAEE